MPFIRTNVHQSMSQSKRGIVVGCIHDALIKAIGMPEDELFNMVNEYTSEDFFFNKTFNGYKRSDTPVVIEITMRRGRSDAMKRDLFRLIAQNISVELNLNSSDIFIFVHENDYSDWSVGGGKFAMTIAQQIGADN